MDALTTDLREARALAHSHAIKFVEIAGRMERLEDRLAAVAEKLHQQGLDCEADFKEIRSEFREMRASFLLRLDAQDARMDGHDLAIRACEDKARDGQTKIEQRLAVADGAAKTWWEVHAGTLRLVFGLVGLGVAGLIGWLAARAKG